jgi:D-3-phosphoglycerate dehydrogenase
MKVLYLGPQLPSYVARHRARLPAGWDLVSMSGNDPRVMGALADADFLVVLGKVSAGMIRPARRLRLIQMQGAGYEQVDLHAAAAQGIPVATAGGANAGSVAEHAVALMLSVLRRIPAADAAARNGQWLQMPYYGEGLVRELGSATVGLVGFGHVGQAVARMLRGFGSGLLYFRRHRLPAGEETVLGVAYRPLAELLQQADVVSVQVPLSDQTRGMIGKSQLMLMKPSAVLVNVSRGAVVDERALIDALTVRGIAGAGLDVFEHEPLPADHPLLQLQNVVVTPHIAGAAVEAIDRTFDAVMDNLQRVARGLRPLWLVGDAGEHRP